VKVISSFVFILTAIRKPPSLLAGKVPIFTHPYGYLKILISLIFILFHFTLTGQTTTKPDYNFGFEKISYKNNLPLDWFKWGTENYSLISDSVIKHSGTYSLLIQSNRLQSGQSFGCAAYEISPDIKGTKIEIRAYMKLLDVGWEGIMNLPIDWIERFDVLFPNSPAAMVWGERGKGGVISVVTRIGAPAINESKVYHSVNVKISGYDEARIFFSPVHHSTLESDYKPDLRTTLFWEPNIKLENNAETFVNYYNADNPGLVRIVAEGITSSGIPVTGQTEYEVK
jgi:hypothetical protein